MAKKYTRQLTSTEKAYILYDKLCSPYANQIILEGRGVLDYELWERAVHISSDKCPGSRLLRRGWLFTARWIDSGIPPRLREVDGSRWDGRGNENAPFLQEHLPPDTGPTCEVLLIHGSTPRVAFRSHHGVMDGRGTLIWAEEIFRALRGDQLNECRSRITEYKLAGSFQKKGRRPAPHIYIAPTGTITCNEPGFRWKRITIQGRIPGLIGRIAVLMAQEAWKHGDGPIRFAIPVDMRPRRSGIRSTGNLTNLIYLDVDRDSTPEELNNKIREQLDNKNDGLIYWGDKLVRFMPMWVIYRSMIKERLEKHASGLYRNSGVISNPGRLPLESLTGGGFITKTGYFIPIHIESIPIFIATAGTEKTVELTMGMPRALAGEGRFEKVLNRLEKGFMNR